MTESLSPERLAVIRATFEVYRRAPSNASFYWAAADSAADVPVLLAENDRLRALDRNAIANEAENEKFLVAACAVIDSVLDTDGNDGLLADIQRLADEVKELRAALAADTTTRTDWGVRYTALDDERVEAITRVAVTEDREDSIRFRDHTNASRKHYGTKLPADAEVVTRAVATSPWQVDQVAASTPPAEIGFAGEEAPF